MKQSKQTSGTHKGCGLPSDLPALKLDGVPETVRPFVKIGMKVQSEVLELWGHRARAWLDWPDKCCTCKTADDLTSAQSDYIARMQGDYKRFLESVLRDAMIGQDTFEEDAEDKVKQPEPDARHREAA